MWQNVLSVCIFAFSNFQRNMKKYFAQFCICRNPWNKVHSDSEELMAVSIHSTHFSHPKSLQMDMTALSNLNLASFFCWKMIKKRHKRHGMEKTAEQQARFFIHSTPFSNLFLLLVYPIENSNFLLNSNEIRFKGNEIAIAIASFGFLSGEVIGFVSHLEYKTCVVSRVVIPIHFSFFCSHPLTLPMVMVFRKENQCNPNVSFLVKKVDLSQFHVPSLLLRV